MNFVWAAFEQVYCGHCSGKGGWDMVPLVSQRLLHFNVVLPSLVT